MLKRITSFICCFCSICFSSNQVYAQSTADSATAYNNITDKFYNAIGAKSRLYNGAEYDGNYPGVQGSAFFTDAADWGNGNIVYDGYLYKNIKIHYDLYKDLLVIPAYNSFLKIALINNKMQSFDVYGHHFVYIKNNPTYIKAVDAGYYDQLYGGKIQVLCKRSKSIQQDHSNNTITPYFLYAADYYVFKNNEYFPANSRGDFLDVFKDKKKEVQQFIRTNKLKFKKDTKEQFMARIAEYYDHIKG